MEQEVNQNLEGSTTQASGEVESKQVSYDSFRKSVEAEKNARKRAQDLESKLQEFERKEMEAKGEFDKLKQSLLSENENLKQLLKKKDESYLWERVTSGIKTEALKAGCSNPEKLIKLLDKTDFESLQADADGYNVKPESLQALIEKAKKENDFLFSRPEVKVNDLPPKSKIEKPKAKAPNEMSKEELAQAFKANLGQIIK